MTPNFLLSFCQFLGQPAQQLCSIWEKEKFDRKCVAKNKRLILQQISFDSINGGILFAIAFLIWLFIP